MTEISCCMISWCESRTIDLALKSVAGFANEVVIADNGSFDGTQKIARRWLRKLKLGGEVLDVKARTLGQVRMAAWDKCTRDWILLIDSNLVLSNALKAELRKIKRNPNHIGAVQSLNLMGDYNHYFTGLPFHAHHMTFFNRNSVSWGSDRDRPVVKRGMKITVVKPWAVNLSRVRPAWRCWYRGEPFDKRFYRKKKREAFRTPTNRQDKWITARKYDSLVDYVRATTGKTLKDVKRIAPKWYLNYLNEYAVPLKAKFRRRLPEVIKAERKKPRYKLIYKGKRIVGRRPNL